MKTPAQVTQRYINSEARHHYADNCVPEERPFEKAFANYCDAGQKNAHKAIFRAGWDAALSPEPNTPTSPPTDHWMVAQEAGMEKWEGPAYEYGVTWGPLAQPTASAGVRGPVEMTDKIGMAIDPEAYKPGRNFDHEISLGMRRDAARDAAKRVLALITPSAPKDEVVADLYRHVKRGTIYEVIGSAELQAANGAPEEGAILTIYRGDDGEVWARRASEFGDGRFERVGASSPSGKGGDRG